MTLRLFIFTALAIAATVVLPQSATAALNPKDEYIIISGGPALQAWEGFRREAHRHDGGGAILSAPQGSD